MARKLPGLQRVLDAPALFSVAYGEIASSIYFALGIIALHALGLTPEVLALRRRALPARRALVRRGHGRDPRDRRRRDVRPPRVQRPRRLPHRLGALPRLPDRDRARGALPAALPRRARSAWKSLEHEPVGRRRRGRRDRSASRRVRLVRRSRFYRYGIVVAVLDLSTQLLLVVLGFALLFSPRRAHARVSLGDAPELARARLRAAARDARVHGARDGREPRRGDARARARPAAQPLRRDRRSSSLIYVAIAVVGLSRVPGHRRHDGARHRLAAGAAHGIVDALERPAARLRCATALRVYVGLTGALILLVAATTSISGFGRLAYSLGEHGQLPRAFGRLNRRTLVSPQAIVAAALISIALMIGDVVRARATSPSSRASSASACCSRSRPRSSR